MVTTNRVTWIANQSALFQHGIAVTLIYVYDIESKTDPYLCKIDHQSTQKIDCYLKIFNFCLQDYDTKDLVDFEETILKGCDFNKDGKISRKELTMILLALSKQSSED